MEEVNKRNALYLNTINGSGEVFLSHTKWQGNYIIRVVLGQTYLDQNHINKLKKTLPRYVRPII
jgi:aromatic-L-amino-acid decarboxylase